MIIHDADDGRHIVHVVGDLDLDGAAAFEAALGESSVPLTANLVVDLTQCHYLLSVSLVSLIRAFRDRRGLFKIRLRPEGQVFRVMSLTSLDTYLPVEFVDGDRMYERAARVSRERGRRAWPSAS